MSHHVRNRRRSVAPCVDPLEGRSLLSRVCLPLDDLRNDAQADIASRDESYDAPVLRDNVSRSAAPIDLADAKGDIRREPADNAGIEPDALAESPKGDPDPRALAPKDHVAPVAASSSAAGAATDPSQGDDGPAIDRSPDPSRRALPTIGGLSPALAVISTGIIEATPLPPGLGGSSAEETPLSLRPAVTPETPATTETGPSIPMTAGIIAQTLPFSGEAVMRAVDELFERFDDLEILETVESIATQPLVVAAGTCVVTLGVVEIARRLRPANSETNARRAQARAMVPSLKLARPR
jgi:hypothetical protein